MLPIYYPRVQFNGVIYWNCIFCAHINETTIRPTTIGIECSSCERRIWYGMAFHVPINSNSQAPKDNIIPRWADDEYPFDTIPQKVQDAMTAAFFDPNRKVHQRSRVNIIVIHDNIYAGV